MFFKFFYVFMFAYNMDPLSNYSYVREKWSKFDVQMRPDEISQIFYLELY